MEIILTLLLVVCSIVSIVCWIMTLVKLFQKESALFGVLGIICPLFAFIMGFVRMKVWEHQKIMMAWVAAFVIAIILQIVTVAVAASSLQ